MIEIQVKWSKTTKNSTYTYDKKVRHERETMMRKRISMQEK